MEQMMLFPNMRPTEKPLVLVNPYIEDLEELWDRHEQVEARLEQLEGAPDNEASQEAQSSLETELESIELDIERVALERDRIDRHMLALTE